MFLVHPRYVVATDAAVATSTCLLVPVSMAMIDQSFIALLRSNLH